MNLKNLLTLCAFGMMVLLISSCKTYSESLATAGSQPLEYKLPAMSVVYKNSNGFGGVQGTVAQVTDLTASGRHILVNEIQTNCLEELKDSVSGTIQVELTYGSCSMNIGFPLLSGFTACTLNLLGMPFTKMKFETDICISVFNADNMLVKSYKYHRNSSAPLALYYGATGSYQLYTIGKYFAEQFKADLARDAAAIAPYLNKKVYYPMGNNAGKHILKAEDLCWSGKYKAALKELDVARGCSDLNAFNERIMDEIYDVARSGRNEQLQQRAEAWAAVGAAVATAGAATAATISSNRSSASSSSSSKVATTSVGTSGSSSSSGSSDELTPGRKRLLEEWIRDWEKEIETAKHEIEISAKAAAEHDSKAKTIVQDAERRISEYTRKIEEAKAELNR